MTKKTPPGKLSYQLYVALGDIKHWDFGKGYPAEWKPMSRRKLEAMGFVEAMPNNPYRFRITEAGEKALKE